MKIKMILKNISIIFLLLIMLVNKNVYADAMVLDTTPQVEVADSVWIGLLLIAIISISFLVCLEFLGKNENEKRNVEINENEKTYSIINSFIIIGLEIYIIIESIRYFQNEMARDFIILIMFILFENILFLLTKFRLKKELTQLERLANTVAGIFPVIIFNIGLNLNYDFTYIFIILIYILIYRGVIISETREYPRENMENIETKRLDWFDRNSKLTKVLMVIAVYFVISRVTYINVFIYAVFLVCYFVVKSIFLYLILGMIENKEELENKMIVAKQALVCIIIFVSIIIMIPQYKSTNYCRKLESIVNEDNEIQNNVEFIETLADFKKYAGDNTEIYIRKAFMANGEEKTTEELEKMKEDIEKSKDKYVYAIEGIVWSDDYNIYTKIVLGEFEK